MSETNPHDSTDAGEGAQEPVYVVGLGGAMVLRLSASCVLLAFLAAGVFGAVSSGSGPDSASSPWLRPALYIVAYIATIVAHELVHGLFFRLFGGAPGYGVGATYGVPYFYATSPGDAFSVREMIVIGLAPLVTLSTLALLGGFVAPVLAGYFAVVFISNTAGAVGDLWMVGRLVKFLPVDDATVVDLRDGMAVYSRAERATQIAAELAASDKRPAGFVVHWVGAAMAVLAAEVLAAIIGPIFTESLLIGPAQFPLVAFARTGRGFELSISVVPALVAGLVFAIAAHLITRRLPPERDALPPVG